MLQDLGPSCMPSSVARGHAPEDWPSHQLKKSCLAVSPQALASAPAPRLLATLKDFQWTNHTLYLKKPTVDHDALCKSAIQCAYSAWAQIKRVLKEILFYCTLSNAQDTLKVPDRYVGASFLWFVSIVSCDFAGTL